MLLFGHTGITLGAVWALSSVTGGADAPAKEGNGVGRLRSLLRRPDFRLVLVGSMLPDIIDKPLWLLGGAISSGRALSHSVVFQVLLVAVVLIVAWRYHILGLWSLAAGSLLHVIEDEMWRDPEAFLWPAYGWASPEHSADGYVGTLVNALLHEPRVYVPEVLGAAVLLLFVTTVIRRRKVISLLRHGTIR